MVSPAFTFGWLGLAATLIIGQLLLCGGEHPDQEGNVAENVAALITTDFCDDLHFAVQILLWALINVPGLILIFSLLAPFLNNTITGTLVGLLGIGSFAVGFL